MALFKYSALDTAGVKKEGKVDARNKAGALTLLREKNYYVLSIDEISENAFDVLSFRGVPFTEVTSFTRQLSTMISAGLPMSKALEILADQTTNKKFRLTLSDVLRDVEGGASLGTSFSKYPEIFSTTYCALVRAGEASGKLDQILLRLADTMESQRELKAKIKGAMIYPVIVLIAMVGVFFVLMLFVVPKLGDLYISLNVELPFTTKLMIIGSQFMTAHLYFVLLAMAGTFFGLKVFFSTNEGKYLVSRLMLVIPVFGKINRQRDLTEFTRTLSLLMASAVPIVEALDIVASVVNSRNFEAGAQAAGVAIQKGGTLSDYLKSDPSFPPILGNMVATGEETGRLDEVLDKLATFFNSETEHTVKGLSAALEPLILILLGVMVAFMIISIITPIYKITTSL